MTDTPSLPPLKPLRAFEAAARRQSFTKAAEELHVTQGAVSHQVKALEDRLGVRLFHRRNQHILLTEQGRAYLAVVQDAFGRLAAGTRQLLAGEAAGVLTVSVSPNFAAKWMVHRLGRFAAEHPDLGLRIAASMHRVDFAREGIDVAVRHGDGDWPDLHVARLCEDEVFPVCAPRLLESGPPLRRPEDLRRHVLLRALDQREWDAWLEAAGIGSLDIGLGPVLEQLSMAIDAAVAGQGVSIARSTLAAADLLAGRLARPFPLAIPRAKGYFVVSPKESAQRPKVARFRAWLLAEAAAERRQLAALTLPTRRAMRSP